MRILLFVFLTSFCFGTLVSQSRYQRKKLARHVVKKAESKNKGTIIVSLDTIFNKGIPYAILKEKKKIPYNEFTLRALNNEPLIEIIPQISINRERTPYYAFYFTESGNKAELEKYYGLKLEKQIIESELIKNNRIDPQSETFFLVKYTCRFSDTTLKHYINDKGPSTYNNNTIYEPIKRNRDAKIYIHDGKILQDYKLIGFYKMVDSVMRIYLPNNIMVAEVTKKDDTVNNFEIISLKDRKISNIVVTSGKELEEVASYLCENNYL